MFLRLIIGSLWLALSYQALHGQEWARAIEPREWTFPRDHGAHPEFKTEWWYYTGNLKCSASDKHFGYQLTFFRQGVQPSPSVLDSSWSLRDIYFAHFAITDVSDQKFYSAEKVSRGNLDQAAYSQEQMDIRLNNWQIQQLDKDQFKLRAKESEFALELEVNSAKPMVLQGQRGLSRKTDIEGEASYYYSYTRLLSQGTIRIGDQNYEVQGNSWFDHEFMTNVLSSSIVGWDWFSIQLDSNQELMLYQLRNDLGQVKKWSKGVLIQPDGSLIQLDPKSITFHVIDTWKSSHNGAIYPSTWKIEYSPLELELLIKPQKNDQEFLVTRFQSMSYWEGTCQISGKVQGQQTQGYGYTELTGYSSPIRGMSK